MNVRLGLMTSIATLIRPLEAPVSARCLTHYLKKFFGAFFILSDSGEVMLEKQLTGHRVDHSICARFWDQVLDQGDSLELVPVIASPTHYLFHVVREGIIFLACTQVEMPPLMAIEEMLKDAVKTKTYQNVIYKNPFLYKDKVALNVGVGTGILSLFLCQSWV